MSGINTSHSRSGPLGHMPLRPTLAPKPQAPGVSLTPEQAARVTSDILKLQSGLNGPHAGRPQSQPHPDLDVSELAKDPEALKGMIEAEAAKASGAKTVAELHAIEGRMQHLQRLQQLVPQVDQRDVPPAPSTPSPEEQDEILARLDAFIDANGL